MGSVLICFLGLIAIYVGIISAFLPAKGATYGGIWRPNYPTEFRPMFRSKEIGVMDGAIENKENIELVEILKFRGRKRVDFYSVINTAADSMDKHVGRSVVVGCNHSSGRSLYRAGIIHYWLLSVLDFLNHKIPYNDSGGRLPGIREMYSPTDWREYLERILSKRNIYPRALVFSHGIELAAHNDELVNASSSEYTREYDHDSLGQVTFPPQIAESFAKSHKWLLFILSCGLSLGGIVCLLFGCEESRSLQMFVYFALAMFAFALIFVLAHWSYK